MKKLVMILLAIPCLSCSRPTFVDNPEARKRLNEQAAEITNAIAAANFEKVADMTYPSYLEAFGGRDNTIALQKRIREDRIASGGKVAMELVDDPGDMVESQAVYYSYVPVAARIQRPSGEVFLMKSVFIAVSLDQGKTWKFIDDAGIPDRKMLSHLLPHLPSNLELPIKEAPTRIKE